MSNLLYNSSVLLDAIYISSSADIASSPSSIPRFVFGPSTNFEFGNNFEYYLSFNAVCQKLNDTFTGRMDVYLQGSAFPNVSDPNGYLVGSLFSSINELQHNFGLQEFEFLALNDGTATLNFFVYSGLWYVSNIKFQIANWSGFNPDEATIQVPVDTYRYRPVKFKAELYDINNNVIPTNNFTVESSTILITGSNTVVQGVDNFIAGTMVVAPSGSGAIIGTDFSGSYLGLAGGIDSSSLPRPINPFDLSSYLGVPIITLYSGNMPFNRDTTSGSAMGIQILDGATGSFLDFNTVTGILSIRGEIELLPNTPLSQSIASGSGLLALMEIQNLVDGSGSNLPTGIFLSGNVVFSPIIAGNSGYFSTQFGVGNIVGGSGIVLTALGYTGSDGTPIPNSPAIYIGQGTLFNENTPFIVASSSVGPVFSLGNKLFFDSEKSSLTISSASVNATTVKVAGTLTSLNANIDNGIFSTLMSTGSVSASNITTSNLSINNSIVGMGVSGNLSLGNYNIIKVASSSFITGSQALPAVSSSAIFNATSQGGQISNISAASTTPSNIAYNGIYNITFTIAYFSSETGYVNWTSSPYGSVTLAISTDGGTTYTNYGSWNASNIQITKTINLGSNTSFLVKLTSIAGADISQDNPGGSVGSTTVRTSAQINSITWQYYANNSSTTPLNRFGLDIETAVTETSPHIHMSPINTLTTASVTAGDLWFESLNGQNYTGSLKYFDGSQIIAIAPGGAGAAGPQGPTGPQGPSGSVGPAGAPTGSWTGQIAMTPFNFTTVGTSAKIDWNSGSVEQMTLGSTSTPLTISFANALAGAVYVIEVKQNSSGNGTISWPVTVTWPGGLTITQSQIANATDVYTLLYNGTSYRANRFGNNY